MYDQILFPTDGSEPAESALEYALEVATEHDATLNILNVADTTRDSLTQIQGEVVDSLEKEGERIVEEAAERARERDISVTTATVQGVPSSSIGEYSDRIGVDLIVMATHGRKGLKRALIGSVTERVVRTAEVPVITISPRSERRGRYPCENLLVPIDGSSGADAALRSGIAIAERTDTTLHLLYVVETASLGLDARSILQQKELTAQANETLEAATARASDSVDVIESQVVAGTPAKEIRRYIQENDIGLAVLGTHGETDFSRYMLGGVSSKLIRSAEIPVMWTRSDDATT